jgi:hypothetical protein
MVMSFIVRSGLVAVPRHTGTEANSGGTVSGSLIVPSSGKNWPTSAYILV